MLEHGGRSTYTPQRNDALANVLGWVPRKAERCIIINQLQVVLRKRVASCQLPVLESHNLKAQRHASPADGPTTKYQQ
jgi:hypothetical protein